jgi:hypothetical protein
MPHKKKVTFAQIVYEILLFNPEWTSRNHVVIYGNEITELADGTKECEVIAEYEVNRAELKKLVSEKLK